MKTMEKAMSVFKNLAFVLVTVSLLSGGCAQDVGEIDRTQLDIFNKKDLEGEWYMRMTTTDAPYSSFFTFMGDTGKTERGVFELTESHLVFYRTYEFTANAQLIGLKSDTDQPYLVWLAGDEAEFTPNPYQARDKKFAEGRILASLDGAEEVSCDGTKPDSGGMHDYCRAKTGNNYSYCGHESDSLLAERTHDGARCVEPTRYVFTGAPLAAYPIEDHLDVTWSYNSATGEKTNVLEENTEDLFWYEREYVRVDWGTNDVTNYEFTLTGLLRNYFDGDITVSDIYVTNFEGEAAPEEDQFRIFRDENEVPQYMDYVSRYIIQAPKVFYVYWNSDVPMCVFFPHYVGGVFECSSEEVKARTAFMKVDHEDDYRPWQYDDQNMDKFGYFRAERQVYDELYYGTYQGVQRHVARFDIWDSHGLKEDGTMDYAAANPVPIVYHLSEEFPRDLVPAANELARQWAKPFDDVVAFHKGVDAIPQGGMFILCENNNDEAQAALAAGEAVAAFDHPACADMEYVKRMGDLRYSFLSAVNPPSANGLLGYGPPSMDPLTGKILSSSAYVYIPNLRLMVNRAADMVQLMTGYLDYKALVTGADIDQKFVGQRLSIGENPAPTTISGAQDLASNLISDKVQMRVKNFGFEKSDMDWAHMRMSIVKGNPELDKAMIFETFRRMMRDPAMMVEGGGPLTDQQYERMALRNWANHRGFARDRKLQMEYAKHNMYRAEFADGAMISLAKEWKDRYSSEICNAVTGAVAEGEDLSFKLEDFGIVKGQCAEKQAGQIMQEEDAPTLNLLKEEYDPHRPIAGDTCMFIDQVGYDAGYYWVNTCTVQKLGWQISHAIQFTENRDEMEHWVPSPWLANTTDPDVAKSQKFVRGIGESLREEMVQEFKEAQFLSVALHEVGHTVGLRHNFEGSTDAMNFQKKFWDLKVAKAADGETYVPVDLWSQETDYQKLLGLRGYQYSSIMDYGAKINSQWQGLGLYDIAAVKFGYGGMVEVFDTSEEVISNINKDWLKYTVDPADADGSLSPAPVRADSDRLETLFKRVHYTQIPNVLDGVDKIYQRKDVLFDDLRGSKCDVDGDCAGGGGCAGCTECRQQLGAAYCSPPLMLEVPYRFCSDEYAARTPTCDVWDEGADAYEIVRNSVDDYWWYWPFWGRWRGSVLFSADNYANRILWAFSRLKRQFQWWGIEYARFNSNGWWKEQFGIPWEEDLNGGLAGAMGAAESFNTLINVFAIPTSSGSTQYESVYGLNEKTGLFELSSPYNYPLVHQFVLEEDYGKFSARPMYSSWAFIGDDMFPVSGGAIYDRLAAFQVLTDPTTDFLNIEEDSDARKYLISFFTFFPDKMITILGGLTTHRSENYAPCVVMGDDNKPHHLRLRNVRTADDPDFCKDGVFLFPEEVDYDFTTTWYRIPMLAAYYGMSLMINDYDRRFMDATRVFLKGHESEIELPDDAEVAQFTDPMTGKTYVAFKVGDDSQHDIAFHLVQTANAELAKFGSLEDLQASYEEGAGELQRLVGLLELIMGLHAEYDYSSYGGNVAPEGPED
jgi:hypothetical protein